MLSLLRFFLLYSVVLSTAWAGKGDWPRPVQKGQLCRALVKAAELGEGYDERMARVAYLSKAHEGFPNGRGSTFTQLRLSNEWPPEIAKNLIGLHPVLRRAPHDVMSGKTLYFPASLLPRLPEILKSMWNEKYPKSPVWDANVIEAHRSYFETEADLQPVPEWYVFAMLAARGHNRSLLEMLQELSDFVYILESTNWDFSKPLRRDGLRASRLSPEVRADLEALMQDNFSIKVTPQAGGGTPLVILDEASLHRELLNRIDSENEAATMMGSVAWLHLMPLFDEYLIAKNKHIELDLSRLQQSINISLIHELVHAQIQRAVMDVIKIAEEFLASDFRQRGEYKLPLTFSTITEGVNMFMNISLVPSKILFKSYPYVPREELIDIAMSSVNKELLEGRDRAQWRGYFGAIIDKMKAAGSPEEATAAAEQFPINPREDMKLIRQLRMMDALMKGFEESLVWHFTHEGYSPEAYGVDPIFDEFVRTHLMPRFRDYFKHPEWLDVLDTLQRVY
ncbi:MAG TPA: hypothetical protein VM901_03140 [Bdellovibrionota bacterium]|jgi:hypothetical protein|nr:hypothetical protein [Bdellovibrionota bacterium]